jgi:hypothetical protein
MLFSIQIISKPHQRRQTAATLQPDVGFPKLRVPQVRVFPPHGRDFYDFYVRGCYGAESKKIKINKIIIIIIIIIIMMMTLSTMSPCGLTI